MTTSATSSTSEAQVGSTVVITHQVPADRHAAYEQWLTEIGPLCRAARGHLDLTIIRPIVGLTSTYTVILRFDTRDNVQAWMTSTIRAQLIAKAAPLLVKGDDYVINSGLDFWFLPAKAHVPTRWKQYLVTWSAIYPLVLAVPLLVKPALAAVGLPDHHLLTTLVVTGIVVFMMVYVVMPRYTRLIQRWLFA